MTVTLRDVAAKSGVSIRTVSNVVNGYAPVAEATRLRVQATIDVLGYRPNLMARNLKQGRSRVIALVVPELDVPYFAELTRLVIAEARSHGYTVIIDQTDGDELQERELVVQNSRALGFDGVILSPVALSQSDLSGRATTVPIVLLGERMSSSGVDHVAIDNVAAAREATTHLISRGRRRIAAIGDQPYNTGETAQLRTIGYRQAHEQAGLKVDETLVLQANRFHRENGAQAMADLLTLETRPDALFCYNDLLALGAMRVALTHGIRIPEDLAVAGFDNIEDGQYSTPTLTTVAPDKHEIAHQAVSQLIARIDSTDTNEPREIRAGYNLVVRESTAGAGFDAAP
jgi:LacI family transcriptional regulator, repressor for deo operon, udp, cdd, tsx, nupC, and nupG